MRRSTRFSWSIITLWGLTSLSRIRAGVWLAGSKKVPVHDASAMAEVKGFEEFVNVVSKTISPSSYSIRVSTAAVPHVHIAKPWIESPEVSLHRNEHFLLL